MTQDQASRTEHDSMGEVQVPEWAKWAAQTQRATENFPISGIRIDGRLIAALAAVKGAAAVVNASNAVPPRSRLTSERWSLSQPAQNAACSPHSAQVASSRSQSSPAVPVAEIRKPTAPRAAGEAIGLIVAGRCSPSNCLMP